MKLIYMISFLALCIVVFSCKEFVSIDPPRTDLIRSTTFATDQTANAAVLDMYYQLSNRGFAAGDQSSISFLGGLSADESVNLLTSFTNIQAFSDNNILPSNTSLPGIWNGMYTCIYKANAVLEGVGASTGVTAGMKNQLEGESKFMRAFCYFYLINLFGDVPLVLTTNYQTNENVARTAKAQVYQQIIQDLTDAQGLLPDDFSISNGERVRANKATVIALLARAYLFTGDWVNAEAQSTLLISNSAYSLAPLNEVFLANSTEAILQLPSPEGTTYDYTSAQSYYTLQHSLVTAFEVSDQRAVTWVSDSIATKYNSGDGSFSEYSMVLRLAEQYLIRAEARAQQNSVSGAQGDINVIRTRAGLGATSANDKTSLLQAIAQERRVELFSEWGHRWLDLKRYNSVDSVLSAVKSGWQSTAALYPIPAGQILNDLAMTNQQNPGY